MKKLLLVLTLALLVSACSNEKLIDDEVVVDGQSGEVAGVQIFEEKAVVENEQVNFVEEVDLYTKFTISEHSNKRDCWTIINDKVYDLTEWLSPQPSGIYNLRAICGTDGTLEFGGSYLAGLRAEEQFTNFFLGNL
jgi:cytochrome b involved in lipid metabolism